MPRRLQRRRSRGWRMPADAVARYRRWLAGETDLMASARAELVGRDLVCWCAPDEACHADVLLQVVNGSG